MSTKDEYLEKAKQQLTEWEGELESLQTKAGEATDDLKAAYEEQAAELRTKLDAGKAKIDEITEHADDLWEELKDEAEEKWAALQDGLKDSVEKIKSFFA
jgi:chromosome segregation ATPase